MNRTNIHRPKVMFIRAYTRVRFGRRENVRQHYRSLPFRL
jgi:hypothetical protein